MAKRQRKSVEPVSTSASGKDFDRALLAECRNPELTDFAHAWVGIEPTFQSRKSVRKWQKLSADEGGEDAYFADNYMLSTERKVAKTLLKRYRAAQREKVDFCIFDRVKLKEDVDQWQIHRQNLHFSWDDGDLGDFEVKVALDPETFEYSIKPVPLAWFYDPRFLGFLELLWAAFADCGLTASIAHGGAQFSVSAKSFLGGSLLADDIAYKLSHPELSTWVMDWPNPDDRAFRATRRRFTAFREVVEHYWRGGFHPRAIGTPTAENAYLDRSFGPSAGLSPPVPAPNPRRGLMRRGGPQGNACQVFQTNFAFGRAVKLLAQSVHPGYWQAAHPKEDGYRPDQIMRYSEGNLARLQIAGEWHVKSGEVLDSEKVPELDAPLELSMLTGEASWENRGQMGRTSSTDFVEALLLDMHHAQYLQSHPKTRVKDSILQDQLLGDAAETLRRHGAEEQLGKLHREARKLNLEASGGRINSDWIEPERLFWAAWKVLPASDRSAIAHEAVSGFLEYVANASTMDPRANDDSMEWHRHRIHPELWSALASDPSSLKPKDAVRRELKTWQAAKKKYLRRRPVFSQVGIDPPWKR